MSKHSLAAIGLIAAAAAAAASMAAAQTAPKPAAANPNAAAMAEERGPKRPALLFKEEWKSPTGKEVDLSAPSSMRNPDLDVHIYGQGAVLKGTGHDNDEGDPPHVFSGECKGPCAFTLSSKKNAADLTGLARVRVETKMSGFHHVYPIVKLASGDWYIADKPQGGSIRDWLFSEFNVADARWTKFDAVNVVTKGNPVDKVDLSKVEEIGFADLMPASGHGPGGWFDVGQIEVYGKPVAR